MKIIILIILFNLLTFGQSEVILLYGSDVVADETPPSAPTSLVATADNDTAKIRLTWTDPTAADLDSIRIYRAVIADTSAYTYLTRVAAGVKAYTNTGLTETTAYWYKLKAVDDSSNVSGYSNRDSALTFTTAEIDIPDSLETALTVLWLESDSGVTKTASGDSVNTWADISDANHDFTQTVAGTKPIWSSSGILFDGTNDVMRLTWTQAQPVTIYIVAKSAWTSGDQIIAGSNTGGVFYLQQTNATPKYRWGCADTPILFDTTAAFTTTAFHLITLVANGASSIHTVDDVYSWTGEKGTTEMGGLTIAANEAGTGNFANAQFKVIIIRKYADNEATRNAIKAYLNEKYTIY